MTGNGADKKIRTSDPIITNDVLYQLSYIGTFGSGRKGRLTGMQPRSAARSIAPRNLV